MKRIRYEKTGPGNYEKTLMIPGTVVDGVQGRDLYLKVVLNTDTMEYAVLGINDSLMVHGTGVSAANLKIKVKRELQKLGMVFDNETRVPRVASSTAPVTAKNEEKKAASSIFGD
jgi:hypothetical protein